MQITKKKTQQKFPTFFSPSKFRLKKLFNEKIQDFLTKNQYFQVLIDLTSKNIYSWLDY